MQMCSSRQRTIRQERRAFLLSWGKKVTGSSQRLPWRWEEARRNLGLKFPGAVKNLATFLDAMSVVTSVSGVACPIDLPAKDRPIFLTALAGGATHLLTGDRRHFGSFMDNPSCSAGIVITTVGAFLEGEVDRT